MIIKLLKMYVQKGISIDNDNKAATHAGCGSTLSDGRIHGLMQ